MLPSLKHVAHSLVKARSLMLVGLLLSISFLVSAYIFRPSSMDPIHLDEIQRNLVQLDNRISLLEGQRANLEKTIARLKKQISDDENRITQSQSETKGHLQQIAVLSTEIDNLRNQIRSLDDEISRTQSSLTTAEYELRQTNSDLDNANAKVYVLQNDLNSQRSALGTYRNSRAQAENVYSSLASEWNQRAEAYNKRVDTFNQKLNDYSERLSRFWNLVRDWIIRVGGTALLAGIAYLLGVSISVATVKAVFDFVAGKGLAPPGDLFSEYNNLKQLNDWLTSERSYLESESRQLNSLKGRLEQASSSYEYWKMMVQNQENVIARTESDLSSWSQKKDELVQKRNHVQANINSLRSQLDPLTSRRTQLQSSLDTRLGKKTELEGLISQKENEIKIVQQSVGAAKSERDVAESELLRVDSTLKPVKAEANVLRHELLLIQAQPYLVWGGISLLGILGVAFLMMIRRNQLELSSLSPHLTWLKHFGASVINMKRLQNTARAKFSSLHRRLCGLMSKISVYRTQKSEKKKESTSTKASILATPLSEPAPSMDQSPTTARTKHCHECALSLPMEAKHCPKCGTKQYYFEG